jgi:hypothetical protein
MGAAAHQTPCICEQAEDEQQHNLMVILPQPLPMNEMKNN